MGISVGCQILSRVTDELFTELKGKCLNFLEDVVVYWPSVKDQVIYLRKVLGSLKRARYTLNPEGTLGATKIKYLGHMLSSRGIKMLSDRIAAIQRYPHPTNLKALRRFIGMVGFYARFIPGYSRKTTMLHGLKRKDVQFVWCRENQVALEPLQ
jgi:hypothetical protein